MSFITSHLFYWQYLSVLLVSPAICSLLLCHTWKFYPVLYHTTHSVQLDSLLPNLPLVDGMYNGNGRHNGDGDGLQDGNAMAMTAMDNARTTVMDGSMVMQATAAMEGAMAMRRQRRQWKAQQQCRLVVILAIAVSYGTVMF